MENNDRKWEVLHSEYLIQRPWLTARRDCVRLPNGVENDEYYVLEYPDWVNVIAITAEGKFLMNYFIKVFKYLLLIDSFNCSVFSA
jgi:hypothetical protein